SEKDVQRIEEKRLKILKDTDAAMKEDNLLVYSQNVATREGLAKVRGDLERFNQIVPNSEKLIALQKQFTIINNEFNRLAEVARVEAQRIENAKKENAKTQKSENPDSIFGN